MEFDHVYVVGLAELFDKQANHNVLHSKHTEDDDHYAYIFCALHHMAQVKRDHHPSSDKAASDKNTKQPQKRIARHLLYLRGLHVEHEIRPVAHIDPLIGYLDSDI